MNTEKTSGDPGPAGKAERSWARRLEQPLRARAAAVWGGGAAVLLAAAVVAFVLVSLWRAPVTERLDTTDELADQAGAIVAEVFTAQAQTWRSDRARARQHVTPQLAASAASGLTDAPPAGVRAVRWEPLSVGVVEAYRDWGTALVVAEVVVTTSDGQQRTETKSVSVDLVRSGDRWLLSGLDELQ